MKLSEYVRKNPAPHGGRSCFVCSLPPKILAEIVAARRKAYAENDKTFSLRVVSRWLLEEYNKKISSNNLSDHFRTHYKEK